MYKDQNEVSKQKPNSYCGLQIHWSFSTTLADNDYDVVGAESSASHL